MSKTEESYLVSRTCTRKSEKADEHGSFPLESFRNKPAYVLLGDPGAGKTEAFKLEASNSDGKYIRARDFATFELGTEYQGKTLFIDGLDEMRADGGDGRTPLDHIRKHLERLGRPRFRLSCREADWLGASDSEALKRVSLDGDVIALHLDPLSDDNIVEILRHKSVVADPNEFMRKAQEYRLNELLRNPQTLNLLVDAVGGDAWPKSRTEIYAMACSKLVREINLEHRQAKREKALSPDALLEAAGYLCATQLLSGIAGFALDEARADAQHYCWKELKESRLPLLAALKTNLFHSDGEELRIPVHRSVAEFLGANYLASRIENHGLSFGRVLALMTGEDGGIVTDLRGLAAWLAVHCFSGRQSLIERDPLGVVLYGDVRNFQVSDKQQILAALKNEAKRYPWFISERWSSTSFGPSLGALCTLDMEPIFREILSSPSREEADQSLLDCVLDAIRHGEQLSSLANELETVVRDASYWPVIRNSAVSALMHVLPDHHTRLLKLAEDIRSGIVEDRDDEMLGSILDALYPRIITSKQIFDYFHTPKQSNLVGMYFMFWTHYLPKKSLDEDLTQLLDQLVKMQLIMQAIPEERQLNRLAGGLLVHGLEASGDKIDDQRLYNWLGVGLDEYDHPRLDGENTKRIAAWFAGRPERYKAVIEYGATLCADHENQWYCMSRCEMRLYGSVPPAESGMWYLNKAAAEQQKDIAGYYFTKVIHLLIQQGGQRYLTLPALEFIETWTAAYPTLQPWLDQHISCNIGDWQQEQAIKSRERKIEHQKRKSEWVRYYRQHIAAIRDGSAFPQILHDLAQAHEGLIYEANGETPHARLEDFLDGDIELIDAAYAGFRHVLDRTDLPTVSEIVDMEIKGKMHYVRSACLVGMSELYQADPTSALHLADDVLSRLLVFRFAYSVGNDPPWLDALVRERPALVAEMLLAYVLPMLRAGKEHISGLYSLAHNDAYAEVARLALPKLLEGFPLRVSKAQLSNALDPLLKGALHYLDGKLLSALTARKLKLKGMDAAQQVYWLSCGLLVAPKMYESKLIQYIGKSAVRRGYLASFLYSRVERRLPDSASMSATTLAHLIEMLGPDCSPERPKGAHWVSPAMNTADMVLSFINTLGGNPDKTASHELERLLTLQSLASWHNSMRGALHTQRIARRKASFQRLSVAEVDLTLANLQPASAADLAALTFDYLRDIARKIRDGSTDDYKQYWSYNENNTKLVKPKPENDCRNALLSDLKERLGKLGIDAQRESSRADNKRADILISYGGANGFNTPIEAKKDDNPELWRSIHEQLIPQYVRDPGADGHGIYLVFWFGGIGISTSPDGGKKPRSAQELEERLQRTLAPEESHRILICVIDCALP